MKALVAGWFSFPNGHATAGDILTRDLVCRWLDEAGMPYDIAVAPPFRDGIALADADPAMYTHAVFVCGPFEQGELEAEFLQRFSGCRLIGINLSMPVPLSSWNPWDRLFERDSSATAHPDLAFAAPTTHVPVAGLCLVEAYPGALVADANAALTRLAASRAMAVVPIDTRLDDNMTGLRSASEVESLIARLDVMLTTRLHGTVLALKHGVPAVVIDPEAGGAKLVRQGQTLGWPCVFSIDTVSDAALEQALAFCLSEYGRAAAAACRTRAQDVLSRVHGEFIATLTDPGELEAAFQRRRAEDRPLVWWSALPAPEPRSQAGIAHRLRRVLRRVRHRTRGLLRRPH